MNRSISQVLAWKERQFLLPATIGMLATYLIVLLITLVVQTNANQTMITGQFFGLAMMYGTLTALMMGTFAFCPEREQGTAEFLRSFPVSGQTVAGVKIVEACKFFLIAWIACGIIAALVLWVAYGETGLTGISSPTRGSGQPLGIIIALLVPIETFLISLIASAYCKKSINAVILAAALAVGSVLVASFWFSFVGIYASDLDAPKYMLAGHVVLLSVLTICTWNLTRSWLTRSTESPPVGQSRGLLSAIQWTSRETKSSKPTMQPPRRPMTSLLWQMALARWPAILACLVLFLGWIVAVVVNMSPQIADATDPRIAKLMFNSHCGAVGFIALVISLTTFSNDHSESQFRFFQQRADYLNQFWLSRQLPILLVSIMVFLLSLVLIVFVAGAQIVFSSISVQAGNWQPQFSEYIHRLSIVDIVFVYFGVASVGQLISMLCRSGIILFLLGCMLGPAIIWYFGYVAWLDEPLWIFGWPLVIGLFLLSWVGCGNWIREKRWAATACTVMAVALLGICLNSFGLAYHRYHEIDPLESPRLARVEALMDSQDAEWASDPDYYAAPLKLKRAFEKLVSVDEIAFGVNPTKYPLGSKLPKPLPDEIRDAEALENQPTIELIIEALRDDRCRYFPNMVLGIGADSRVSRVWKYLQLQFEYQLEKGNLDKALDAALAKLGARNLVALDPMETNWFENVIRWADAKGQTRESLSRGLREFDAALDAFLDPDSPKLVEALHASGLRTLKQWYANSTAQNPLNIFGFFPFWEVERSKRLWQQSIESEFLYRWASLAKTVQIDEGPVRLDDVLKMNYWFTNSQRYVGNPNGNLKHRDHTTARLSNLDPLWESRVYRFATARRYTKVRLALAAYRAENGAYPESLSELAPNYLSVVPKARDGREFCYSAKGLDAPVIFKKLVFDPYTNFGTPYRQTSAWTVEAQIPANQPFLLPWSGVAQLKREFILKRTLDQPDPTTGNKTVLLSDSETGYWLPNPSGEDAFSETGLSSDVFQLGTTVAEDED